VQAGAAPGTVRRSPFGRFRPGEEQSVSLAREVPGFGGFYIDDSGDLHAYLLDLKSAGAARAALARTLVERQRSYTETERALRPRSGIIIHQGQFTFYQLAEWRNAIEDFTTSVPGVVFVGLDEHLNRVAVGADRSRPVAVRALVVRRVAEMGIPPEAITFELTDAVAAVTPVDCAPEALDCQDPCTVNPSDPSCGGDVCAINPDDPSCEGTDPCVADPGACDPGPDFTVQPPDYTYLAAPPQTLGSPFATLMGGIRIRKDNGGACTLGFVVTYQGRRAFVTNSHCTRTSEYLDHPRTEFFQPDWSRSAVGREWIDDFKRSMGYRMADASIAELVNGYQGNQAYIARPATRSNRMNIQRGDTTLAPGSSPWIRVTGEGTIVKDAIYDKVGATTGWTYGAARGSRTCVKWGGFECATWIAAGAWDGDSGAPVLRYYTNNTALLVGMAFARADGGFWMNPMSQIRKHFSATGASAGILRTY
jgi:hypothetical protein